MQISIRMDYSENFKSFQELYTTFRADSAHMEKVNFPQTCWTFCEKPDKHRVHKAQEEQGLYMPTVESCHEAEWLRWAGKANFPEEGCNYKED